MNSERFIRSEMLLGSDSISKLNNSSVIIFGLGGVGSYTAEALARAGVGKITLVDNDVVSISNINRQLCALSSTIGKYKTDVVADRIRDINPDCVVTTINEFYLPDNNSIDLSKYDYIADAIDTMSAKIDIIKRAGDDNIPVISCMGTGNKLDPSLFRVSDISKTEMCPVCKVIRHKLKETGIKKLNVVWSPEVPVKPEFLPESSNGKHPPASISFVPGVAGLIMAGKIINDIVKG